MALYNYASKEITLKVVYYGPGLCGKTTNLQWIHSNLEAARQSRLLSLATETDRTLFFDFLPMDLGTISGFKIKFQLYTVPGQVRYDATRRLVLKGADAVVFVADSQKAMKDSNIVSYENLKENLTANNLDIKTILLVFQYNKRDLPDIMSADELNRDLNEREAPWFEASAISGKGVEDTLLAVTKLLAQETNRRQKMTERAAAKPAQPAAPAAVQPTPPPVQPAPPPPPNPFAPSTVPRAAFDQTEIGGGLIEPASGWADDASGRKPSPVGTSEPAGMDGLVRKFMEHLEERRRVDGEMLQVLKDIRDRLR